MGRVTFFRYWVELENLAQQRRQERSGAPRDQAGQGKGDRKAPGQIGMALARNAMEKAVAQYKKPISVRSR